MLISHLPGLTAETSMGFTQDKDKAGIGAELCLPLAAFGSMDDAMLGCPLLWLPCPASCRWGLAS
jgi:hypothetical protein